MNPMTSGEDGLAILDCWGDAEVGEVMCDEEHFANANFVSADTSSRRVSKGSNDPLQSINNKH